MDTLASLIWTDAPITVRIGPENADLALPPIATVGKVLDASVDGGVLRIALADDTADLKRPLLVDRFAGTGGIEGPAEWNGMLKPRAWGRCFNVVGRPIDTANNIWCFAEPVNARYLHFDVTQPTGQPISAGIVMVGKAFRPALGQEWGAGRRPIDTGSVTPLLSGGFSIVEGARKRHLNFTLGDLSEAEADQLEDLALDRGDSECSRRRSTGIYRAGAARLCATRLSGDAPAAARHRGSTRFAPRARTRSRPAGDDPHGWTENR